MGKLTNTHVSSLQHLKTLNTEDSEFLSSVRKNTVKPESSFVAT